MNTSISIITSSSRWKCQTEWRNMFGIRRARNLLNMWLIYCVSRVYAACLLWSLTYDKKYLNSISSKAYLQASYKYHNHVHTNVKLCLLKRGRRKIKNCFLFPFIASFHSMRYYSNSDSKRDVDMWFNREMQTEWIESGRRENYNWV